MLGEPALLARLRRGDAQRVAFLAQERIAAVARSVGPDLSGLGIVDDPFVVIAGPRHIGLTLGQGRAEGVDSRHKHAVLAHQVQHGLAHPGHDAHRNGYIAAVGDLDAEGAELGAERTHRERHDVHRAAGHAAVEKAVQARPHLHRVGPVVGRAGVGLVGRADEGPALDAGHVLGVRGGVIAAGAFGLVQFAQRALTDQISDDGGLLGLRTVAPVNPRRLGQGGDLLDPGDKAGVFGGSRVKALDGGCGHNHSPERRPAICAAVALPCVASRNVSGAE